ncbi:MAG TPA: sigma 54-interacting transcriptional regulator [Thermoanaerobaculia bacterium]|nr:sigma 54-interacting transcriptional regulator [Thermoanaerobaculia bacterium]
MHIAAFEWGVAVAAVLRHTTLPWHETLDAVPLTAMPQLGGRDKLSLVAQFAAHQALLQFAGVSDDAFDRSEWAVVRKRGADARLVRIAARAATDAPPALTIVQQFAEDIEAPPIDALRQSWGRPDAVYWEIDQRLRHDAAADLRWMRAAAIGEVASPAPDGLRTILAARDARLGYSDEACIDSLRLAHDRVVVLGETPSPLAPLREIVNGAQRDAEIVERLVAAERLIVIVKDFDRFDADARRVVELFAATGSGVLLMPGGNDLPGSRQFIVSPRLTVCNRSRRWLREFVETPAFHAFLDDGVLPPESTVVDTIREPARSLLAALSLLGRRVPRTLATRFLGQFFFGGTIDDLAAPGIARVENDALVFEADLSALVPAASRESLYKVAAELIEESRDEEALRALPRRFLSPKMRETLAHSLVRAGRYRDARELAGEPLLALIERRTGEYVSALSRNCDELLRAELLDLLGRRDEALATLASCAPNDRRTYLHAVISGDYAVAVADPYLAARLAFYRTNAVDDALAALAAARTTAERIDAALDHLFALFTAGRWPEARAAALDALTMIDETQGDRAAGGILYILAFLAADDGQCAHAAHLIERLERFYRAMHDEQRLRELDLLRAQLELSRGRFAAAARAANAVVDAGASTQIVEAAKLILDEIDAIEGRETPLRSTGTTPNVELTDRHALLCGGQPRGDFARALVAWQAGGPPPEPSTGSEKQKLFRFALRIGRRSVAESLGIPIERDQRSDLGILRVAATATFPFAAHDFGALRWRFATRNRLGHWSEIGSLPPLDRAALDRVVAEGDWMPCGERELLFVEGAHAWSAESRDAVAAIFRLRSENYRLQRVLEQEESGRQAPSVDGIVGESAPMRDVFALIGRVGKRDVAVCILGESGTGKELVARAVHRHSSRRHKTFTAVNCAALPETLIESELFGCVRGAFTGADRDRPGLIETTDGGTLFLDEVGEMPLAAQAKLLRFLQDGELRRVGDTVNRSADVRIVTATNRKLEAAVEQGRFREDLYYRICGVEIALPPLRERAGDVALLANHFLALEREKHRGGPASLALDVVAAFSTYHWPGNVRELQNTVRAAHALAGEARAIDLEHLPPRLRERRRVSGAYHDEVARFRRELIERSLDEAGGNQNQAATMLNMSRQALAYQIRELGILVKR